MNLELNAVMPGDQPPSRKYVPQSHQPLLCRRADDISQLRTPAVEDAFDQASNLLRIRTGALIVCCNLERTTAAFGVRGAVDDDCAASVREPGAKISGLHQRDADAKRPHFFVKRFAQ